MLITSKDNETIKEIKKLKEKKYRKEKFIIEGIKMIEEAIQYNAHIELVVYSEKFKISDIENIIKQKSIKTIEVTESIFNTLTEVVSPQGILAVVRKNENSKKIDYSTNFILALDGIQDPGNLGTIIRTADATNLKQIIVSKDTVDTYSPKVIRSTMGAIFRVNVIEVEELSIELERLKKEGFKIITTSLQTEKSIYDIDYKKSVVVIGNEANGVSDKVYEVSNTKVKIPMPGKAESLNASVAAGVMMYEYVRKTL